MTPNATHNQYQLTHLPRHHSWQNLDDFHLVCVLHKVKIKSVRFE
jgi:hypothetical protein